jgi:hypothetical protein
VPGNHARQAATVPGFGRILTSTPSRTHHDRYRDVFGFNVHATVIHHLTGPSLPAIMEGYDRMISLMAAQPDVAMFPRFSVLNNRMLCYTQAQLLEKQDNLIKAIREDQNSTDRTQRSYAFDLRAICQSRGQGEGATKQKEIMTEIAPLLNYYST